MNTITDNGDGTSTVQTPSAENVTIDTADLNALLAAGLTQTVRVTTTAPKRAVIQARPWQVLEVARLILKPDRGADVLYIDGNPLNLRKSNLALSATPEQPAAPTTPTEVAPPLAPASSQHRFSPLPGALVGP